MEQVGVRVGFLGVGVMGAPMARNLLEAGFAVATCVHRNPERVEALVAAGARRLPAPAAVAREADVVITMLPDSPEVEAVALGEGGVIEAMRPDSLFIDMSTCLPATEQRIAAAARPRGVRTLDAPVSGGETGAINGTLTIMVGGEAETFEAARPVLAAMGRKLVHVGPTGSGQVVKIVNNLMGAINAVGVAEGLTLGVKAGVPAEVLWEVITNGSGNSRWLESAQTTLLRDEYRPGFALALMLKDIRLAMTLARELNVPLFEGSQAHALFTAAHGAGYGREDASAVARLIQDWAGVRIATGRPPEPPDPAGEHGG